jgi:hypothetical protein
MGGRVGPRKRKTLRNGVAVVWRWRLNLKTHERQVFVESGAPIPLLARGRIKGVDLVVTAASVIAGWISHNGTRSRTAG